MVWLRTNSPKNLVAGNGLGACVTKSQRKAWLARSLDATGLGRVPLRRVELQAASVESLSRRPADFNIIKPQDRTPKELAGERRVGDGLLFGKVVMLML